MVKKTDNTETKETAKAVNPSRRVKPTPVEATQTPRRASRVTTNPYSTLNSARRLAPYKATPAAKRGAGAIAHLDFRPTPRMTRLRAGVGLEAIPSPVSLKPKSAMKGMRAKFQLKKQETIDELASDIGSLGLDAKKGETKVAKRGRKGKKTAEKEEPVAIDKSKKDAMDPALTEAAVISTKRYARTRSQVGNKRTVSDFYGDEEEVEFFDLEPVVPPSLQQKPTSTKGLRSLASRITIANSDSDSEADSKPTLSPEDQEKIRKLIVKFQEKAASACDKQLWEIEDEDVKQLQDEIEIWKQDEDGEVKTLVVGLLQGMLDVSTRFQAFRDSFDLFLDDADKVGMGLDWEKKGLEFDTEEQEEEDEEVAEEDDDPNL